MNNEPRMFHIEVIKNVAEYEIEALETDGAAQIGWERYASCRDIHPKQETLFRVIDSMDAATIVYWGGMKEGKLASWRANIMSIRPNLPPQGECVFVECIPGKGLHFNVPEKWKDYVDVDYQSLPDGKKSLTLHFPQVINQKESDKM